MFYSFKVVIHCLATYLDCQLPAFTDRPDRRPFTGQYLVKCPEKPQPTSNPLIVEVQLNPPHYKLVMGADEYELPKVNFSLSDFPYNDVYTFGHRLLENIS